MQDYNTIIGTVQMYLNKCPSRSIMDRYKIGSGTVSLIMSRYRSGGFSVEELRMMPPKEVESLFYPQKNLQRKDVPLPDFQYYYDRIHTQSSKVNISFCRVLKSSKHEEQAYNACAGILHRVKTLPQGTAEEAARKCIEMNSCKYFTFKQMLKKMEARELPDTFPGSLPLHENIRGKDYYK